MTIDELAQEIDTIDAHIGDLEAEIDRLTELREQAYKSWADAKFKRIARENMNLKIKLQEIEIP